MGYKMKALIEKELCNPVNGEIVGPLYHVYKVGDDGNKELVETIDGDIGEAARIAERKIDMDVLEVAYASDPNSFSPVSSSPDVSCEEKCINGVLLTSDTVPRTIAEAMIVLDLILDDEDREFLLENGALSVHHSLGRHLRNEWHLWDSDPNNLKKILMDAGMSHPDDMSNYIIEKYIEYLKSQKR